MNLLAIESTGARASAALIDGQGRTALQGSEETMNHLQHLIPMIQQLLENSSLSINDIAGILVSEGPGSFTGIRIGVATARALAQALNVPIVGVPTLRSFAYHMEREDVVVCPVFDARRQQVYAGAYLWQRPQEGSDCGDALQIVADGAYDLGEFLEKLKNSVGKGKVLFFGDGLDRYEEDIRAWVASVKEDIAVEYAPKERRYQEALSVAKLGRRMFLTEGGKQFGEVEPVYLRQAEAQRKLEERLAQEKLQNAAKAEKEGRQ